MANKIVYEWCYESVDNNGDITDADFFENLTDFYDHKRLDRLCLVRMVGDEVNGENDRLWAYVTKNKLPETFEDSSIIVPKRFHTELLKVQTTLPPTIL